MPRGIGLEVSGEVDAVGDDVKDVRVGDKVFGVPDFQGYPSAGAADYAILNHWAQVPPGLDMQAAAGLPMATETAFRTLECFGDIKDRTFLIHGAGTTVGFAAVQLAIMRGARVFATAGETFAGQLRGFGAAVTPYGAGMVERVLALVGGAPDMILDITPGGGALPELIEIAGGDAGRILTITDPRAQELGVRVDRDMRLRYDVLGDFAKLAADGRYIVPPVAGVFEIESWREALEISLSGHAHGKLILRGSNAL
jgi:NADPH:quinone reductase-like Zn-dependent oxidoreductase